MSENSVIDAERTPASAGPPDVPVRPLSAPRRKASPTVFRLVVLLVAAGVALLIGYPLVRIVLGLVWVDGTLTFSAVSDTLALPGLGDTLLDTFIVTGSSVTLALVVGSAFAWLNERTDARMGVLTDVLPVVNFLMPGIATAVGWLLLMSSDAGYVNKVIRAVANGVFGANLTSGPFSANSWYTVIGVYTLTLVPFVYLVVSAGLRNLDSRLEEQSRMCGAGVFTTLVRVTLPALRPSLLSAAFLAVWFGFAVFSVPVVLAEPAGIQMLSVEIVHLLTSSYPPQTGAAIGLSSLELVVLGVIWLLQQRSLRGGRTAVMGGKGSGTERIPLGRLRGMARAAMLLYLFCAVLLPVGALTLVTLNGYWGNPSWENFGLGSFWSILTDPANQQAIVNSLLFALVTATVAVVIGGGIAWLSVHSPGTVAKAAAAVSKVPAAIPPVVVAVGMVLAFAGEPFFLGGTALILLMGFLVVAMPEASITSEAAAGQVGKELGQASSLSGASQGRTFRSVYLPLMLPGLAAGWTLIFVRIMADVEASALLASTGTPVIGFQLLAIFEGGGGYAELAALALFVSLVSMVMVAVVLSATSMWQARRNRQQS
ncbi:ABC transporter permease [Streptomyces prasinus]|uniref:ABC transporter permease n=1 Tax=Streptomyces prasinus TaxID=67345 RepID=UPI0033A7521E